MSVNIERNIFKKKMFSLFIIIYIFRKYFSYKEVFNNLYSILRPVEVKIRTSVFGSELF